MKGVKLLIQKLSLFYHVKEQRLNQENNEPSKICDAALKYNGGIGGATRDRTADLLNANQALSQLSYSP